MYKFQYSALCVCSRFNFILVTNLYCFCGNEIVTTAFLHKQLYLVLLGRSSCGYMFMETFVHLLFNLFYFILFNYFTVCVTFLFVNFIYLLSYSAVPYIKRLNYKVT